MTEQQLVAAGKGQVEPCTQSQAGACGRLMNAAGQTTAVPRLYIASTVIAGEPANVAFFLDDNQKLSRTIVNFDRTHFRRIVDLLNGIYGQPVEQRGGTFATSTWRDQAKGTLIKATDIAGTSVRVNYEPIRGGL